MSSKQRANLTLLALAISAFAIGSTEFISVGLMPLMIKDFGITMSQAGLTVSMYALGITIGAPILAILTSRWPRKNLLLGIMVVFIIGNLTVAFAPVFAVVLVGRIISSLAHGIFMSIASVVAADVVEPERRASAIAVMFTGLTVATVTGVPLGTFIGQVSTWHMSFIFIAAIGVLGLVANWFLVPNDLLLGQPSQFSGIIRVFKNKAIVVALLITALGYGGTFTVYTFVTPILESKMVTKGRCDHLNYLWSDGGFWKYVGWQMVKSPTVDGAIENVCWLVSNLVAIHINVKCPLVRFN